MLTKFQSWNGYDLRSKLNVLAKDKAETEEENQDVTKYTSTNAIDNNVEGLAAKANIGSRIFGTNAGQAKQAVNARKQLAPNMIKAYNGITAQIKAALNNINNPTSI